MSDTAIRAEKLSKQYTIGAAKAQHNTLRDQLMGGLSSLIRRNRDLKQSQENFWALKDVSFEVKRGEIVGIIGRNGAGKSTLLKLLSRITKPSKGRAEIYGRVGSLLEVGTGFHPELTGRENIYLNGTILGMRKTEIERKFAEIVAFAETEKFLDTPVKHYSSGMYVRLAFAVAAHLEPEILLVDEVLAVGDAVFQRKCLGKMGEVATQGRTVLFVSHNMAAITRLCKRGLWLENSQLRACADVEAIVAQYLTSGSEEIGEVTFGDHLRRAPGSEYIRLLAVRIRNDQGRVTASLDTRLPFVIEIEYRILRRVSHLRIGFRLIAYDGTVVFSSTDMDNIEEELEREKGTYLSRCTIPGDFLNHGQYFISVASDFPMIQTHFFLDRGLSLRIEQTGGVGRSIPDGRLGMLRLKFPWNIQKVD